MDIWHACERLWEVGCACGTLVAARFKRGHAVEQAGANDILHLPTCIRSGLYDDFRCQRRGPPTPAVEWLAHYVAHPRTRFHLVFG